MKNASYIIIGITLGLLIASLEAKQQAGFIPLFNGNNYDGLYLKLRNGNSELAEQVFAIEDQAIHVFNDQFPAEYNLNTGKNDTHGLFYTKKPYSKYILRFEYKWGSNIANNFAKWQYDAGVYYHVINDRVWPTGIEYQIRYDHRTDKNHTGDLIRPQGVSYSWFSDEKAKGFVKPSQGGTLRNPPGWMHVASATENFHGLDDKWNHCEIIVMGSEYAIHKLNGEVVNIAVGLNPSQGIIGFQSETAEIFYRNIEIKEFQESIPMETFLD